MGIGADLLADLLRLKQAGELDDCDSVVEIGAQQLAPGFLEARKALADLFAAFGRSAPAAFGTRPETRTLFDGQEHSHRHLPYAQDFWRALGFDYAAIDIDGSPHSIPLDLNYDQVPPAHVRRYGLVTNFGTTEHVANQLNCFKVIHDRTRPGGLMLHDLPAQGFMNHGLVNYNVKFFWMLARSNDYRMTFLSVMPGGKVSAMPENIKAAMSAADVAEEAVTGFRAEDTMIKVLFRKLHDFDYVPPLDVPSGSETGDETLRRRYWTVFGQDAFTRLLETSYLDGAMAYSRQDYEAALALWRPLAERGDAEAAAGLGLLFANGEGVPADDRLAARWFLAAAERGNKDAQRAMSQFFAAGRGVARDEAAALRWLHAADAAGPPAPIKAAGT